MRRYVHAVQSKTLTLIKLILPSPEKKTGFFTSAESGAAKVTKKSSLSIKCVTAAARVTNQTTTISSQGARQDRKKMRGGGRVKKNC